MQSESLNASQLSWVSGNAPSYEFNCTAKTRYRQTDQACRVSVDAAGNCFVKFDELQRAVTPGQSVVFYDNENCLGGGIIDSTS
jgi:tRNA-specific 2-thiouridylase